MNYNTNSYYQSLVDILRRRRSRGGLGWPGKPVHSSATTLYPNIAAEMYASVWRGINTMAEFAGVSQEVMVAVIEDGEELSPSEQVRLANRWEGRGPGYLCSAVLQIVDPDTNKGKRRRRELADLMEEAAELPDPVENVHGLYTYWKREALDVHDALKAGDAVTFAEWWWACHAVKEALEAERSKSRAKRIRTARRTTA